MNETAAAAPTISALQHARERSIALAIVMDAGIVAVMATVSLAGGSFTLLAESIRGGLGWLLECFSFTVLRRIHRGVLADFDYGTGKLEQIANLVIGAGMLSAAGWIGLGALRILSGERGVGSPMGLACAAVVGIVNLYINVISWDAVRRAAAGGDSLIMQAQLLLRWTKLVASLIVGVDLTVAALSTDDVIVAWADALGSAFVAAYIALNAFQVLRGALPDLLDRSAGEAVRRAVDHCLAQHADAFTQLRRVRSRRSGHTAFVEIALAFDGQLSMAEVERRVGALRAALRERIGNADVSIQVSAATNEQGAA